MHATERVHAASSFTCMPRDVVAAMQPLLQPPSVQPLARTMVRQPGPSHAAARGFAFYLARAEPPSTVNDKKATSPPCYRPSTTGHQVVLLLLPEAFTSVIAGEPPIFFCYRSKCLPSVKERVPGITPASPTPFVC